MLGGWLIVTCGWLPVHWDQLWAQCLVTSMRSLYLYLLLYLWWWCEVLRSTCLAVCISAYISQKLRPNFTKFSVHITCSRASFVLWWQYTIYFRSCWWCPCLHIMKQVGQNQLWCICSARWRHYWRSLLCCPWLHLVVLVLIVCHVS